jgi:Xaa-Pro dipeptidase
MVAKPDEFFDTIAKLYPAHIRERQKKAEAALAASGFDALVIHAGTPFTYFADDFDATFRPTPHFAHWLPLEGPHHLLCIRAGEKPLLVVVKPDDYWYEQLPLGHPFWATQFELKQVGDEAAAWKLATTKGRAAYIGDSPEAAQHHGIAPGSVNPTSLVSRLDWDRSTKTSYEVACLEEATANASRGHAAARNAFVEGASELEIHQAYVSAVGCVDKDLPYESIVALDEKGATLHYTGKRGKRNGKVLLIDCGAKALGYGSDITRTWTAPGCDTTFQDLVIGVDALQKELCELVKPGRPYLDIHQAAHVKIADLLRANSVIKQGGEEAVKLGLTQPFFPHGVGHFLGIQVHDVSGRQKSQEGGLVPPPPQYPFLRNTRTIEEGQVFTIEPGLYFIEMLLRSHRTGALSKHFNWLLIDRLMSSGGVRIEDNVVVTKNGHHNLTRPYI